MIKNFDDFLNENLSDSVADKLGTKRDSLKKDLIDKIEKSMNSSDLIDLQNWIGKFEEGDSNTLIEELSDDSNIYDFYLKHQDDIDSILSENEWFNSKMSDINASSLYDVVIIGTKKAIELTITELKESLF